MNTQDFDRVLDSIREDIGDGDAVREAGARVRARLEEKLA